MPTLIIVGRIIRSSRSVGPSVRLVGQWLAGGRSPIFSALNGH